MKTFIETKLRETGWSQLKLANKIGISQASINNVLSGAENVREGVRMKIAIAFGLPPYTFCETSRVAELPIEYADGSLTENEKRLLKAFRKLDQRRQERFLETIEDMVLALKESYDRGGTGNSSKESNSRLN